ncbi:DNA polymerase III subunit chi [Loktanella fryxellensis]|nr:DNA polymerase III subunit chi [Loktanella fryxellensis]
MKTLMILTLLVTLAACATTPVLPEDFDSSFAF